MTVEKMQAYLWSLPDQFQEIMQQGVNLPRRYKREYHNIIVTGLGGSAIGGDILRTYGMSRTRIPIMVNRDYDMPRFVDGDSLVLAVSYSGNTEETLSAYQHAVKQGAAVIAVTSGGKLAEIASNDEAAVVKIPGGLSPRAATGYLFAPLALILEELGILQGATADLKETIKVLLEIRDDINPGVDFPDNQARIIARELKGNLPIIWGSSTRSEIAAMRWKTQINENAKTLAFFNIFPELNHNEIVGLEVPAELMDRLVVIILRDPGDHQRVQSRIQITKDIIQSKVKKIIEIDAQGESFLARFYSLAYVGDYTSFYLALEYGINPTPVATIDYLKAELAKSIN